MRSADGQQKINVVVSQAASFKRTFLQVRVVSFRCGRATGRHCNGYARRPPPSALSRRCTVTDVAQLGDPNSGGAPAAAAAAAPSHGTRQQHARSALLSTCSQVTDIAQLGDPKAVARLLLPAGATVLSVSAATVAQPPKNTGTVLGVIERDPVTYYT